MQKVKEFAASTFGRVCTVGGLTLAGVAASTGTSFATVTLEGKTYSTPLGEYVGLIGENLSTIIVAGFAGMALVALGLVAWKLAKRLIKGVA
jgi:hypothetical protein